MSGVGSFSEIAKSVDFVPSELRSSNGALFPPLVARQPVEDWLTHALLEASLRVCAGEVNAALKADTIAAELAKFDFAGQRSLEDVFRWVIGQMESGVVHINHPRYFGLFNPAPTFAAQCADRITAAFNPQLATATTSPFPVALESHVIRAFAERAGMPPGSTGHFTTGGTECNATALVCALTRGEPGFSQHGIRAFRGRPLVYVSREAHLAWLKIAHQTGIGRDAIRLVGTDGTGRLDSSALERAIAADVVAGDVPVMVVATAGTTGAGMIDPLLQCHDIVRRCGAWFHIDAAWGGAVIVSDRLRGLLDGIQHADSVTIDAHKWLATTMGCGMFLTQHGSVLSDSFNVFMECMPSNTPAVDPYVTTVQWSRRFLGLRLFAGLATAGWSGYAQHIEHSIRLANMLNDDLEQHGWRRMNTSSLAVVCMQPPPGSLHPREIAASILKSGIAWVSAIEFEGTAVIRACVTNGETTEADVSKLVTALVRLARKSV